MLKVSEIASTQVVENCFQDVEKQICKLLSEKFSTYQRYIILI